jgi:hypothetical protein
MRLLPFTPAASQCAMSDLGMATWVPLSILTLELSDPPCLVSQPAEPELGYLRCGSASGTT